MLKRIICIVSVFLGGLYGLNSNASPVGFTDYYDYSTWSSSNSNGVYQHATSIDTAHQTLTLMEPDNCGNGDPCSLGAVPSSNLFSHVVASAGTVSFDWSFNWNVDPCCSGFDFYVNSTLFNLADGYPGNPYNVTGGDVSGHFSVAVNAGDTITFDAYSADSCCRAAISVVTNFDAPNTVPEPMSLSLVAAGLIGIGAARRRR